MDATVDLLTVAFEEGDAVNNKVIHSSAQSCPSHRLRPTVRHSSVPANDLFHCCTASIAAFRTIVKPSLMIEDVESDSRIQAPHLQGKGPSGLKYPAVRSSRWDAELEHAFWYDVKSEAKRNPAASASFIRACRVLPGCLPQVVSLWSPYGSVKAPNRQAAKEILL